MMLLITGMIICYLALIEIGKQVFYRTATTAAPPPRLRANPYRHLLRRRAAHFSTSTHPWDGWSTA